MSTTAVHCEELIPGLHVGPIMEAVDFYVKKLGFTLAFTWGDPVDMAGVHLDKVMVHLFERKIQPFGCSLYFLVENADELFQYHQANGVEVLEPPQDKPYNMRDYHINDPYGNMLGFGHFIQHLGEPVKIERVDLPVRLEKRIVAVLKDLAEHKGMSINSTLEETLLHTFEPYNNGVASPHTKRTIEFIQELKKKHGIDYDVHASYRFVEE